VSGIDSAVVLFESNPDNRIDYNSNYNYNKMYSNQQLDRNKVKKIS